MKKKLSAYFISFAVVLFLGLCSFFVVVQVEAQADDEGNFFLAYEGPTDPTPRWEVTFEVKWNAVNEKEMSKIVERVSRQNKDACKVSVRIEKVEESRLYTIDAGTWTAQ